MRKLASPLFLLLIVLVLQAYAKAPIISQLLLHAQYVSLGYETAGGFLAETDFASFTSTSVQAADRMVVSNIYDAITKWKRYVITVAPQQADILIAVRTGRTVAGTGGIRIESGGIDPSTGRRKGAGIGPVFGAEAGPADDYLAVYQSDEGREAVRLWVRTQENGLAGKNPPLFQSFKDEVESAAKKAKKP
ncbi:MAG TPA: hypothetical protein VG498_19140 [Terriglobales bacterium]|nr:hypothetical protein [Terriglobales bacterium]